MFFENRYRRLKIIGLRNSFQVQSTISFLISTFYRPTNIYQFSTSFQISSLLNSKNYRPRICYQNATRYQSPKSEFINESDNLSFTKYLSKLNDFVLFFKMERNELLDVTAYGLRSDFLSPETMPKATVERALAKNCKLLLASVLATAFYLNSNSFVILLISTKLQLALLRYIICPFLDLINSISFNSVSVGL